MGGQSTGRGSVSSSALNRRLRSVSVAGRDPAQRALALAQTQHTDEPYFAHTYKLARSDRWTRSARSLARSLGPAKSIALRIALRSDRRRVLLNRSDRRRVLPRVRGQGLTRAGQRARHLAAPLPAPVENTRRCWGVRAPQLLAAPPRCASARALNSAAAGRHPGLAVWGAAGAMTAADD